MTEDQMEALAGPLTTMMTIARTRAGKKVALLLFINTAKQIVGYKHIDEVREFAIEQLEDQEKLLKAAGLY